MSLKERNDLCKIKFVGGTEIEFYYSWPLMAQKLSGLGLKAFRPTLNLYLTPTSASWVSVELIETQEEMNIEEEAKETIEALAEREEDNEEILPEPEPEKKKESIQEKKERMLAEMIELSSCSHEEYDMYFSQMSRTDKRTGKTTVIKRYFPVCAKCGVREKFVKSADIPEEVKETAKLWDK